MDLLLEGKAAWVVGGSSGLGRATAEALRAEGATVALSSRRGARLDDAASELGAVAVPLDVREGTQAINAACEEVVATLGRLDIVVVNHGGPPPGGFDDVDEDAFVQSFDLVLASAFRLTKAVVPHLRAAGGGVIAYVTSFGTKEIIPELFLSNTMRAGVVGMMKTFSRNLAPDGIRLFCAAPGRFATERAAAIDAAAAERTGRQIDEVRRANADEIPLGRYGNPDEFGQALTFLCSPRASYYTGCTFVLDGGKLLGLLT
jgi:3-oxoacyl-[acyl-carrier protein] reductase